MRGLGLAGKGCVPGRAPIVEPEDLACGPSARLARDAGIECLARSLADDAERRSDAAEHPLERCVPGDL